MILEETPENVRTNLQENPGINSGKNSWEEFLGKNLYLTLLLFIPNSCSEYVWQLQCSKLDIYSKEHTVVIYITTFIVSD